MTVTRMVIAGIAWTALSACTAAENAKKRVDKTVFAQFGSTLFSEPKPTTTKELHFDNGSLLGRQVVIEGDLIATGDHFTYVLVGDTTGRVLVSLTRVVEAEDFFKNRQPARLRILGTVERGKKGLPYVVARSLKDITPS